MAKVKSKWVCQNCGYEAPAYLGKCPECSAWGKFVEEAEVISKVQPQHENKTFLLNRPSAERARSCEFINIHIFV